MLGVMLLMWLERDEKGGGEPASESAGRNLLWGHLLMVGVGFIIMPVLNRVMGFDLVTTNMHKVFIIGCYTVVALLVFASQVEMLWLVGLALAVGFSAGGWLAARVQIRQGEDIVRKVLNVVLLIFIVKLLLFP